MIIHLLPAGLVYMYPYPVCNLFGLKKSDSSDKLDFILFITLLLRWMFLHVAMNTMDFHLAMNTMRTKSNEDARLALRIFRNTIMFRWFR